MLAKHLGIVGPGLLIIGFLGSLSPGVIAQQANVTTWENQNVIGPIQVESPAPGRTRISFWINTRTYLAKKLVLDSAGFKIRNASGVMTVESAEVVTLTGLTYTRYADGTSVLANPQRDSPGSNPSTVTWDGGFKLSIQSTGALDWFLLPEVAAADWLQFDALPSNAQPCHICWGHAL